MFLTDPSLSVVPPQREALKPNLTRQQSLIHHGGQEPSTAAQSPLGYPETLCPFRKEIAWRLGKKCQVFHCRSWQLAGQCELHWCGRKWHQGFLRVLWVKGGLEAKPCHSLTSSAKGQVGPVLKLVSNSSLRKASLQGPWGCWHLQAVQTGTDLSIFDL